MGLFHTFYEAEAVGEKSEGIIPSMATGPPLKVLFYRAYLGIAYRCGSNLTT
jgi:hypothetical protein